MVSSSTHDDEVVRTVVTPTSMPGQGIDAIFVVPGQLSVTSVAPGSPGYHGGRWAVYVASWYVAPHLLTSDEAVAAAEAAGNITVTWVPEADFVCPVGGKVKSGRRPPEGVGPPCSSAPARTSHWPYAST